MKLVGPAAADKKTLFEIVEVVLFALPTVLVPLMLTLFAT
jgi:hypothetical protein